MGRMSLKDKSELATRRFKLLSDENRRAILNFLSEGEHPVKEISKKLKLERTLVSHHLRFLKQEKLVCGNRKGQEILYSIEKDILIDKEDSLFDFGCCKIQFN